MACLFHSYSLSWIRLNPFRFHSLFHTRWNNHLGRRVSFMETAHYKRYLVFNKTKSYTLILCLNILIQVSLEIWDTGSMIYALNKPLNNETGYTWRTSCLCFYFMPALLWVRWLELRLALGNTAEFASFFPALSWVPFFTTLAPCKFSLAAWCYPALRILASASSLKDFPATAPSHV